MRKRKTPVVWVFLIVHLRRIYIGIQNCLYLYYEPRLIINYNYSTIFIQVIEKFVLTILHPLIS